MKREEAQRAIAGICEQVDCKDAVSVLLQAIASLSEGYPDNKLKFMLLATAAMIDADAEAFQASGQQVPTNYLKANFYIRSAMGGQK